MIRLADRKQAESCHILRMTQTFILFTIHATEDEDHERERGHRVLQS